MNVVMLMAGNDDSFNKNEFNFPKPQIEIGNKTIAQYVVESLKPIINNKNNIIFVIKKEDSEKYYLDSTLKLLVPQSKIIQIQNGVSGAAVSVLLAVEEINNDDPLLILNGDQIIDKNPLELIKNMEQYDAGVVVFNSIHPRWSYIKCDESGYVIEAVEKNPISNLATAGFYYFTKAQYYIEGAKKMILKGSNLKGVYYVCPVFNELILEERKIIPVKIDAGSYHSLMTPKMLSQFEDRELKNKEQV